MIYKLARIFSQVSLKSDGFITNKDQFDYLLTKLHELRIVMDMIFLFLRPRLSTSRWTWTVSALTLDKYSQS